LCDYNSIVHCFGAEVTVADRMTGTGCRAGTSCPFPHDSSALTTEPSRPEASHQSHASSKTQVTEQGSNHGTALEKVPVHQDLSAALERRRYLARPVEASKVVQKPVSSAQASNPREYQIQQLRRRFSPQQKIDNIGTVLTFKMAPSDPDFPFDMDGLECTVTVPNGFPKDERPSLRVTNEEMGRGFQINVEKGFDALVERNPNGTLLGWMNALDRQLESLLTTKKADTIKLVSNIGPKDGANLPAVQLTSLDQGLSSPTIPSAVDSGKPATTFTPEQRAQASSTRTAETRQLEARLGRVPLFSKSSDGLSYILPLQPKRSNLPLALQFLKRVKLVVPSLYNLEQCRIELQDVDRDAAAPVETAFDRRALEHRDISLMAHVNFLSQNLHVLAAETKTKSPLPVVDVSKLQINDPVPVQQETTNSKDETAFDARSHIQIIPRPPEWTFQPAGDGEDGDDSSDSYDSDGDYSEDDEEGGGAAVLESTQSPQDRGVLMSFPYLELHGIELLEILSLSLTVKCSRCKDVMDVKNIKNNASGDASGLRTESCKKCANGFSIGQEKISAFRMRQLFL
jgi:hypothetical protein